jgi:hypothetical protein
MFTKFKKCSLIQNLECLLNQNICDFLKIFGYLNFSAVWKNIHWSKKYNCILCIPEKIEKKEKNKV